MIAKPQLLHWLTGTELSPPEILKLLKQATDLKKERQKHVLSNTLLRKQLGLVFDKPSLRTRFSFMIGMTELGGQVVETVKHERSDEEPEDLMRVLQGYCHVVMVRIHEHDILKRMQKVAQVPLINGLSDLHHPCQILADLLTLQEKFQTLQGLTVTYLGDGNNILHSMLMMMPSLGIHVRYCCPEAYQPHSDILAQAKENMGEGSISVFTSPEAAVENSNAIYTDIWTSMGFERREETAFAGYQVNEILMAKAANDAVFMHCLPMMRGKEVSENLPDTACSVIFQQSENRLHVQKALLLKLLNRQ